MGSRTNAWSEGHDTPRTVICKEISVQTGISSHVDFILEVFVYSVLLRTSFCSGFICVKLLKLEISTDHKLLWDGIHRKIMRFIPKKF